MQDDIFDIKPLPDIEGLTDIEKDEPEPFDILKCIHEKLILIAIFIIYKILT